MMLLIDWLEAVDYHGRARHQVPDDERRERGGGGGGVGRGEVGAGIR